MSKPDKEYFNISDQQIAEIEDGLDMDKMRAFDKHNEDYFYYFSKYFIKIMFLFIHYTINNHSLNKTLYI